MTLFRPGSLEKTQAALRAAGRKLDAAAPSAEAAGAKIVARNMAARAPVRTGHLRGSIRAEGSSAVADASYAIPVDRGHGTVPASLYAEEGADASRGGITAEMAAIFRTALGGR